MQESISFFGLKMNVVQFPRAVHRLRRAVKQYNALPVISLFGAITAILLCWAEYIRDMGFSGLDARVLSGFLFWSTVSIPLMVGAGMALHGRSQSVRPHRPWLEIIPAILAAVYMTGFRPAVTFINDLLIDPHLLSFAISSLVSSSVLNAILGFRAREWKVAAISSAAAASNTLMMLVCNYLMTYKLFN